MSSGVDLIQLPADTLAKWTEKNPIIHKNEPVIEIDTGRWKVGTGARYNDTDYMLGSAPTDPGSGVTQEQLEAHIASVLPHPVNDSGKSLLTRYRNRKV